MPTYLYHCPANKRTLEVRHSILKSPTTWGELCVLAREPLGTTDPAAPITRTITGGFLVVGRPAAARGSGAGSCCGEAGCSSRHSSSRH
jgi:hypothetical protein